MTDTIQTLLARNLHEVFGEHDAAKRQAAIDALYTEDAILVDPHGSYKGRAAISPVVTGLLAKFPTYVFSETSEAQAIEGAGRVFWAFGPPDAPRTITGQDVVLTRDGRIAALYVFLD